MKKIVGVIILLATALSLSACSVKQAKSSDPKAYGEYLCRVPYAEDYMPTEEQLGDYSSLQMTYRHRWLLIFDNDAMGLFVSYQEEAYDAQKEEILSGYPFASGEDGESASDAEATVGGYHIRLVQQDYPLETYKMGLLIGLDDENQKICYLFYYDPDLDVLHDLESYVKENFYLP